MWSTVTQISWLLWPLRKPCMCKWKCHRWSSAYQWGHLWARSQAHRLGKCTHQTRTRSLCRECRSNSSSPLLYGSPGDTDTPVWKTGKVSMLQWQFPVGNLTLWLLHMLRKWEFVHQGSKWRRKKHPEGNWVSLLTKNFPHHSNTYMKKCSWNRKSGSAEG